MSTEDRIDELLDRWETLLASDPTASAAEFVAAACIGDDAVLSNELRIKIDRLQRIMPMVQHLERAHDAFAGAEDCGPTIQIAAGAEPIPGYRLNRKIAAGGYGEVWEATGPGDFTLAMKFVRLAGRGVVEQKALRIAKRARHPNLVTTHGAWNVGGYLVIAMELADATVFDIFQDAQSKGKVGISRPELLRYMADAASGIDYLNDPPDGLAGIQHRDVKPQNLLMIGGRVKVADFGIARIVQSSSTGHTGAMSIAYAAPEFFDGKTSNRSDQYSLAVTYCYLLTGIMPFRGTDAEVMKGHLHAEPDIDRLPEMDRIAVLRALSKNPQQRWPSCSEFIRALAAPVPPPITETVTSSTNPFSNALNTVVPPPIVTTAKSSKKPVPIAFVGVGGIVLLLGCFAAMFLTNVRGLLPGINGGSPTIEDALARFPTTFVKFQAIPSGTDSKMSIVMKIDQAEYKRFASSLSGRLGSQAIRQGRALLGMPLPDTFISTSFHHDVLDKNLDYEIALAVDDKSCCIVVIGNAVKDSAWGKQDKDSLERMEGGDRTIDCDWYTVSDEQAAPLQQAFRRACSLQIMVAQVNGERDVIYPTLEPLDYDGTLEKTFRHPGGPAAPLSSYGMEGRIRLGGPCEFKTANGYTYNIHPIPQYAERVLLILPGFFEKGKFVDQMEVGKITVESPTNVVLTPSVPDI